jgi:uncharacterized protein
VKPEFVERILGCLAVVDHKIVLTDVTVAREATALFATMNRDWWASPVEAFIYNEFADALREGLRLGAIERDDLLTEDMLVLAKLEAAGSRKIAKKLELIRHLEPGVALGYVPRIIPKERWLDPPVLIKGTVQQLSTFAAKKGTRRAV